MVCYQYPLTTLKIDRLLIRSKRQVNRNDFKMLGDKYESHHSKDLLLNDF